MKKSKMVLACFVFTMSLGLVFTGSNDLLAHQGPGLATLDLIAGQNIDAGVVSVWNDPDSLIIRVDIGGEWKIAEVQIYAGDGYDLDMCNPTLGRFPYKKTYNSPVYGHELVLDLESEFPPDLNVAVIAVHVDLVQLDDEGNVIVEEGAWARPGDGGYEFECARWGWWFTYEIAHPSRP